MYTVHTRPSPPIKQSERTRYSFPRIRSILLLGGLTLSLTVTGLAWQQNARGTESVQAAGVPAGNSPAAAGTSTAPDAGTGAAPAAASSGSGATAETPAPVRTLLRFTVMSDVHVQEFDRPSHQLFRSALQDAMQLTPDSQLLVLNGDSTNGAPSDYTRLQQLLAEQNHPPVAYSIGNHEFYRMWKPDYSGLASDWSSSQAVQLFEAQTGHALPYHEETVGGLPFLFLGSEAYRDVDPTVGEDAWLSERQLAWLKERLDAYRPPAASGTGGAAAGAAASGAEERKPIFVFLHQPLPGTTDGSGRERSVVQHEALRQLLTAYPDVLLFSGHTHWDAESTKQVWRSGSFTAVGSGSVRDTLDRNDQSTGLSESIAVEVRSDAVVLRFREHTQRRWIGEPVVIPYGGR